MGVDCKGCLCFTGLVGLVTGACLGPTVTLGADFAVLPFFLVVVTSSRVGLSVTGTGVGLGEGGVEALTMRPPRNTIPAGTQALLFHGRLRPFCLWGSGGAGCVTHSTAFGRRPLSKRHLGLFPFRAALVAGCVVSSAAAALELLL
jgi:hypothetical protein